MAGWRISVCCARLLGGAQQPSASSSQRSQLLLYPGCYGAESVIDFGKN